MWPRGRRSSMATPRNCWGFDGNRRERNRTIPVIRKLTRTPENTLSLTPEESLDYWIVAGIAAFMMGLSKGGVPMMALLSVPLMSLYMDPALAAGLLLPVYLIADVYAIYLFRSDFSARNLKILIPAVAIGVCLGFMAITTVPTTLAKALVGIIGLSFVANVLYKRLSGRDVPPRPADVPRGLFWGTISGFTSYFIHAGGPPYQTYVLPQKLDKMTFLGTTAILFAVMNLMKLPPYILAGQVTWESAVHAMWIAPMALLGAYSGATALRIVPDRVFFAVVETALGLVSLKLLYEAVMQSGLITF